MKKQILLLLFAFFALFAYAQQNTKVFYIDGLYYADKQQKEIYTGDYREDYPDGTLKTEIFIQKGKPEGTYAIYFRQERYGKSAPTKEDAFMAPGARIPKMA
ncbi:MAG: hypothetical protein LUI85_04880 [Bacteroides sp.]|nr:hypothetical protein [Bacteroides sp.]